MKTWKKWAVLAALTSSSFVYASTTGSLQIRGNVPDILSIQVNPEADATNLDLQSDQTDLKVASVDLSSSDSFNNSAAAAVAVNKDVTISYTGQDAETMIAGDYEDTVTFSIAAN